MDDLTKRFVGAYNRIDNFLREMCEAAPEVGFASLVSQASARHRGVNRFAASLKRYGMLRNAIVHNLTDKDPLAIPHVKTVEDIEHILKILVAPPKLMRIRVESRRGAVAVGSGSSRWPATFA